MDHRLSVRRGCVFFVATLASAIHLHGVRYLTHLDEIRLNSFFPEARLTVNQQLLDSRSAVILQ
jgi:hypothetical protein